MQLTKPVFTASIFFLVLAVLPLASAVTLTGGTVLNATDSNITLSFYTCAFDVDQAIVDNESIALINSSTYLWTMPALINVTTPNTELECQDIRETYGTQKTYVQESNICPAFAGGVTGLLGNVGVWFALAGLVVVMLLVGLIIGTFVFFSGGGFSGGTGGINFGIIISIVSAIGFLTLLGIVLLVAIGAMCGL